MRKLFMVGLVSYYWLALGENVSGNPKDLGEWESGKEFHIEVILTGLFR